MGSSKDRHNMAYYNQILRADKKKKNVKKKKSASFAKKEVDFSDYLYVPEGLEPVVYTIYFVLIPYIAGLIFLFFAIAGSDWENFKLVEISAFFIVWIIGYEIVATVILLCIFIMFLRYEDNEF